MTPEDLEKITAKEEQARAHVPHTVDVCMGTTCLALQSDKLKTALEQEATRHPIGAKCHVRGVGCPGLCALGPLVTVKPDGHLYKTVKPEDAHDIVNSLGAEPLARLKCDTAQPFFTRQLKIVLENSGNIEPERLEDYIAAGGYAALLKCLTEMTPAEVIDEITRSGLRGRGGAGFPAGVKWKSVHGAPGARKYVVANGDEGDPGAYMDRTVMEDLAHQVLEGMIIAGYAVGAQSGYIYVRGEYPLAVKRLEKAIRAAYRQGLLGARILGTDFSFDLDIRIGAGAFVCGEETALMASVEGRRGMPRMRPPYPAHSGLWGQPTLINNVETFANIAPILNHGAEWYASIGTAQSKGTKLFALAGKLANTGLIEVPMGITLREIIYEIGGGIPGGKTFKAVQTGGPSGGCIPAEHLDTPVDYDSLKALGAIMGSGGMIVMDEDSSMPDVARFFMDFCADESCGKCAPCRVGTAQMHRLLQKIVAGRAGPADLAKLERLGQLVRRSSLCALGQSAPNPVLSTLRYFRHEYETLVAGQTQAEGKA